MSVRFIVRPPNIKRTPKRLSRLLGARRTAPFNGPTEFDWDQDLFLAYPPRHKVQNTSSGYILARDFFKANKAEQRIQMFQTGVPIVPVLYLGSYYGTEGLAEGPHGWVTRPLRHSQGTGYAFRNSAPFEDGAPREGSETGLYHSPCIRKTSEFRVIYCKGQRIATYLKTNPNNIHYTEPWSFSGGCVFHTITRPVNDILQRVNFYNRLDNSEIIKNLHLCACDVLFDGEKAYLCEVNVCPGISIPKTLQAIKKEVYYGSVS